KGMHLVAGRIRELADEHGVPILQAPPLARALYRHADVGDEVPAALYAAVAEVLAWVFQLRSHASYGGRAPVAPAAIAVPAGLDPEEAALDAGSGQ
ncbi:MAG: flagellar biosynthetic protein FlhB, partial [Betaproteobacteria bacterium]